MIPQLSLNISDLEEEEIPSYTYALDFDTKRITRVIDGKEAITQAIYKILLTERQAYNIYTPQYGIEFERFMGKDIDFIKSDIERTITDALLADDRIDNVNNFEIIEVAKDSIHITFDAITTFGDITIKKEVKI